MAARITKPQGRKSDKPLRDALMLALNEPVKKGTKVKKLRGIADKAVEMALDGDREMIKLIVERVDGRVPQPLTGEEDSPIRVIINRLADG